MTNINFCGINIEPEKIVDFLKQEMLVNTPLMTQRVHEGHLHPKEETE